MQVVNIHEAKTNLSRLVERAAKGERIVIARAGRPIAQLCAYQPATEQRKPGIWKGRVVIAEDFDTLPVEAAKAFAGEDV